jgi:hypothetical protein
VELILHIFYCSLIIFGVWNAGNPGFLLEHVHDYFSASLPELIYKPLIGCVICMPSLWGSAYYITVLGLDWGVLLFVPALSGFNYLVVDRWKSSAQ